MDEHQGDGIHENPSGTTPAGPTGPTSSTDPAGRPGPFAGAPAGTTAPGPFGAPAAADPAGPFTGGPAAAGTAGSFTGGPAAASTAGRFTGGPAGATAVAPSWRRRGARIAVAGTLALAVGLGGVAIGQAVGNRTVAGSGTPAAGSTSTGQFDWGDRFGNGSGGTGGTGTGTSAGTTRAATDAEEVGVVDITTVIDYGSAEAAGTGIVLTSNGEILTNNHVVDGATRITVTVVSTGRSYAASVVGTDATDDVAVLQLSGASGLSTAKLATEAVSVGDEVTAVGNAGGTGGTPTAATGTVLALDQSITAGDETGSDSEQLTGMIEVNADIEAGDSGGPLYDDTGAVVGIDTAASSGPAGTTVGFAIPIAKAVSIADRIESGEDSATIQQGTPAFLGVQLATGGGIGAGATSGGLEGALIGGVVDGSPAAKAGLQAGDAITAVDGAAVDGADALSTALAEHDPGDQVRITWIDAAGTTRTATATLVAGPAA